MQNKIYFPIFGSLSFDKKRKTTAMNNQLTLDTAYIKAHFKHYDNLTVLRGVFPDAGYTTTGDEITGLIFYQQKEIEHLTLAADVCALTYLNITHNKNLASITFKGKYAALKHLDISDNGLKTLDIVADLPQLTWLDASRNRLETVGFHADLSSLKYMDFSGNQLVGLDMPEGLSNLKYLYLTNNQFKKFLPDHHLAALEILSLTSNQIKNFYTQILNVLPKIETIYLDSNPLNDSLHTYHEGGDNYLLALQKLKAALVEGHEINNEYKVLLVGDGKSGKTCFAVRLMENRIEEKWDSTHGITVQQFRDKDNNYDFPYILNLWDFGGQDIYHTTHRLFMSHNTTYLLMWNWRNEVLQETVERQEKYVFKRKEKWRTHYWKNRRADYWLGYIAHLGGRSPVIMVQTHSHPEKRQHPQKSELEKKYQTYLNSLDFSNIDSHEEMLRKTGYKRLMNNIEEAIENLERNEPIPLAWMNIRKALRTMQPQDKAASNLDFLETENKTLALDKYLEIAAAAGEKFPMDLLNNWLVPTGVVYYKEGLFNDEIILDQAWAIRAIYTLFNRELGYYDEIKDNKGQFSGQDLIEEYWEDKTLKEQELLISFMLSCDICFEIKQKKEERSSFADRQFIVPELMPTNRPELYQLTETNWKLHEKQVIYVRYQHRFLHYGIIQSFIVQTHETATAQGIYKNGIFLKDGKEEAMVEHLGAKDQILIKTTTHNLSLLGKIRNQFRKISQRNENAEEQFSLDGKIFVSAKKLLENRQNTDIEATCGTYQKVADYQMFINLDEKNVFHSEKQKLKKNQVMEETIAKPKIYFSYAWDDTKSRHKSREVMVDALYDSLSSHDFELGRDKNNIKYGGLIKSFMDELSGGDLIVVFVTKKYLKSPFCMYELAEIGRKNNWEETAFAQRILPIHVERIDFNKPKTIRKYFSYWKEEMAEWEAMVKEMPGQLSKEMFAKYNKIKELSQGDFGKLFSWLGNINASTNQILAKDDFVLVRAAIFDRMLHLATESVLPKPHIQQIIETIESAKQEILEKVSTNHAEIMARLSEADQQRIRQLALTQSAQNELVLCFQKINNDGILIEDMRRMIKMIKEGIDREYTSLPEKITSIWKESLTKVADEADIKGKFKVTIPIVPAILKYEKEVSFDLKKIAREIWRKGIVF